MGDKKRPKEPPFRMENGRKIYTVTCLINSQPRPRKPATRTAEVNNQAGGDTGNAGTEGEATGETTAAGGATSVSGDVVTARFRLLSAVDAYPTIGWLGPQLTRYGHNNAAALRQVPDLINGAERSVPLMWNHSDDIHDKAGRVINATWEESSDIPAGVNADLVVRREYDPKAAIGLKIGELDASSLSVAMEKERSHPDMDFYTFVELAAGPEPHVVDGKLVAWLPVSSKAVYHHALVWAGADPYSGPREQSTQSAATAASHAHSEGDRGMEKDLRKMLAAIANAHGIDVALGPGSAVPDNLEKRIVDCATAMKAVQGQYNDLASKLQCLSPALQKEGETTLSAAEVLNRLPERIEMARHGEAFVKNQQDLAVGWFDKAKGDPSNAQTMSDVDKRERERISNCTNLQELADKIAIHEAAARARFGPGRNMRSSVGEELPLGATMNQMAGYDFDITEGVKSLGLEGDK